MQNQLLDNPSPYLAMHATDPVAWQTWNPQTLAQARREHKPLYVSVGYFACHWCHVMQQESFRNADIATVLNRDFIPVKVDRELETSLDNDLQAFSERTQQQGGWPLNAFVTPEGYPLLTVLYVPPKDFLGVLNRLALASGCIQVEPAGAAGSSTPASAAGEGSYAQRRIVGQSRLGLAQDRTTKCRYAARRFRSG
ncbi:MAG: DUF255 domain-containing protein [Pseudomonadota bacterium]